MSLWWPPHWIPRWPTHKPVFIDISEIIADKDIIPIVTPMFYGSRNMIRPLVSVHMVSPMLEFKMAANMAGNIQKNLIIKNLDDWFFVSKHKFWGSCYLIKPRAAYRNTCLFITDNSETAANHMVGLYYDHMFKYWKFLCWPILCTSQKPQRNACSVSRTTLIFGKFVEDSVGILPTNYQVCPLNRTCFSSQFLATTQ